LRNGNGLSFEAPINELDKEIEELENNALNRIQAKTLERKRRESERIKREVFANLTPWQRVQVARHPQRPQTMDYINRIVRDFVELHGDRAFKDDRAVVAGLGRIDDNKVMIIGHQKGRTTREKVNCYFGCAHPEGYRKAIMKMKLAEKFGIPVVTLIDTPGAYPGIGAEERGQAQAIAYNLAEMARLKVPIICIVIGEGGSGGALGIGVGDRIALLEHAYLSVISPEGCAAILWKSSENAAQAAEALKLTAPDLKKLGVIDGIIPEPLGGAHRDYKEAAENLRKAILKYLKELSGQSVETLLKGRYRRLRKVGLYREDHKARAQLPKYMSY